MERIKTFFEEQQKKTVLDIGTGAGNFIHFLNSVYPSFEKMVGIDLMERAIEAAKKHNKDERVQFQVMDANDMSFEDDSFDVVCLSNSLHHLSDIKRMFKEMKRVVKKDGFIIISEMVSNDLDAMQLSHLKVHHFAAKIDRLLGDTHEETFTKDEIVAILEEEAGLHVVDSWELNVPRKKENTKEELDWMLNIIDRLLSRIPEDTDKTPFEKEAEEIKKYIRENGYDGATTLFTILKK